MTAGGALGDTAKLVSDHHIEGVAADRRGLRHPGVSGVNRPGLGGYLHLT